MSKWFWIIIGLMVLAGGTVVSGLETIVEAIALAIREFEGWYEGSRSWRNHNPGNLKFAGQPGAIGADESGHAIFNSDSNGWAALRQQIRAAFNGVSHVYSQADTFYSFFAKYAAGNAREYAEFVAAKLGVSPDTRLGDLLS